MTKSWLGFEVKKKKKDFSYELSFVVPIKTSITAIAHSYGLRFSKPLTCNNNKINMYRVFIIITIIIIIIILITQYNKHNNNLYNSYNYNNNTIIII